MNKMLRLLDTVLSLIEREKPTQAFRHPVPYYCDGMFIRYILV